MKRLRALGLSISPARRVYAAFFLYALALGGLYPRMAEIQENMGVAEGALGIGLIGTAFGTLISLTFGGPVIERLGHRKVLLLGLPMVAAFYAFASYSSQPLFLFFCLLPAGVCIGAIEQVVNLEADRVEHVVGRRLMNRAHGFWSLGFACAGILGGVAAEWGLSPQSHLSLMVVIVCVATILMLGQFESSPHRRHLEGVDFQHSSKRFAWPTPFILVLVIATLAPMMMEGAGIDWSAIYMRDVFASSPFICGMAVAAGASTQAITRFFADQFVEKFDPVQVSRCLILILAVGVCLVTWGQVDWVSLLGFGLMGVGTSAIFPLAMSAAAQRTDRPAAVNVAALAQTSFVIFLLGPPLLGWVAEVWHIRATFGVSLPLIALSYWAAKALKN